MLTISSCPVWRTWPSWAARTLMRASVASTRRLPGSMPGVLDVITGADLATSVNPLPCAMPSGGVENHLPPHRVLAVDTVHFVGDGVAAVVAEDPYIAHDALELIVVDYEPLPAVVDQEAAMSDGAPQLHDEAPHNICMHWTAGDAASTDAAIKGAEVVIRQRLRNQRLIPNPMETRGAIGRYDAGTGEYTIWMTSQAPHVMKILLAAFVLGVPEHKLRCIAPEVGGGFGAKIFLYADMALVAVLSKRVGRPVKWVETRQENYLTTTHGRDHIQDVELAATPDGTVTALRVRTMANLGAYASTIAPGVVTTLFGRMISGPYKIPHLFSEVYGVFTNTAMVDAYRGAGRPEATYLVERMMDLLAVKLGMDPAEVRRKNFIPPDAFPYEPPHLGLVPYDSGDYARTLDVALEKAGYADLRRQQQEARAQGRLMGIGLCSYVEICGVAPSAWIQKEGWGGPLYESAQVRVLATGKVVAITGASSHGQGHETTFAQVVADQFGIGLDDVQILHGDSAQGPFGLGTYGSRSLAVGGSALVQASGKVREKMKMIGAHLLEVAVEDVEYTNGAVVVKGAPGRQKTFGEIAMAAWLSSALPPGMEGQLEATSVFDPPDCTFPFGTHVCVVEVDRETAQPTIVRYVAVDDVGPVINPMIVDGQIHGGIAQGIGQALYEQAVYDSEGQLVSGTMADYMVPKASDMPHFELSRTVTPSPVNPLGVKGAGETGTIAAAPTVVNAVLDALAPLGITHLDMPLTGSRIWAAIAEQA